jgi:hypothetical protein
MLPTRYAQLPPFFDCFYSDMELERSAFAKSEILYDEEGHKTRLDNAGYSYTKDTCQKENTRRKDRQDAKANSGRDPTKGIQYGFVAGLASLSSRCSP